MQPFGPVYFQFCHKSHLIFAILEFLVALIIAVAKNITIRAILFKTIRDNSRLMTQMLRNYLQQPPKSGETLI